MTTDNIVRVTSYLTKPEYAEKNQNARLKALGQRRVPTTAIVVQTLSPSWLVEIEVIAVI
jgi:enamine deaminase RidA (YjgF/YER057c/UK114 family)